MIHMQFDFDQLEYIIGDRETVSGMNRIKPMNPFSDQVINFFNELSVKLRKVKEYPDVATFGFWCRRAALLAEKAKYDDAPQRLGRGIAFHSTPSNVPVNFAFSFAAGLLAGNANIVRIPAKAFGQVALICDAVQEVLRESCKELSPYICFVKFPPNQKIMDAFSALCDVRIVWGGDQTIAEFRQSLLKPRAYDITFPDRHSIAVMDVDAYLQSDQKARIAQDFYNDTYYTDQNACTAPRIVFWRYRKTAAGNRKICENNILKAKRDFWDRVHKIVAEKYLLAPIHAVGKLEAAYKAGNSEDVVMEQTGDMLITRLYVNHLDDQLMKYKYHSGFFFEKNIETLGEMMPVCDQRCQTLTYYGLSAAEIQAFIDQCRPMGVDRVVPIGKSMDFALVWDGYDLIDAMSRKISVL